jgi:signal transduction histidine kinase
MPLPHLALLILSGCLALAVGVLVWRLASAHLRLVRQAQELRQARRQEALGTLAGGVAHDFNNILASILGFGTLLEEDLTAQPALQEFARQINAAARRGQDIVAQLMHYSRRNHAAGNAPHLPASLQAIVQESMTLLSSCIRSSTRMTFDDRCGGNDIIRGDATQISQAIVNLCLNADQAIGIKPGHIALCLKNHAVRIPAGKAGQVMCAADGDALRLQNGLLRAGNYVRLDVTDDGDGMTRDVAERIFDPFFTTKPVGAGTGLGLAALQGVMAAHGGAVEVRTQRFKGTTFSLFFPAAS